jgi:hypothetical protein
VNANSREIRRRAAFEGTRRPRGPAIWDTLKPAPVQPVPREELLQLALACEAGWGKLKEGNAEKFRTAANRS